MYEFNIYTVGHKIYYIHAKLCVTKIILSLKDDFGSLIVPNPTSGTENNKVFPQLFCIQ